MSSAWGNSWGNSWGSSWGSVSEQLLPVNVFSSAQLTPFAIGKNKKENVRVSVYAYSSGGNYARATTSPRSIMLAHSEQGQRAASIVVARAFVSLFSNGRSLTRATPSIETWSKQQALIKQEKAAQLIAVNNQLISLALRSRLSGSPIAYRKTATRGERTAKQQQTEAGNQLVLLAITAYHLRNKK